jgi:CRP-like cAMP-binding protein
VQSWDPGPDDLLDRYSCWHVLMPGRVAVLDAGFAERIRPWPQILLALLRRAGKRASDLDVQRAIASQPRLEVRLALLLWHLAARWGKVEPGGIRISLPLTHRLMGQLVGAERPSVSHALARLSDAGLVTGRSEEWHLHGTAEQHLAFLKAGEGAKAIGALTNGHALPRV